MITKLTLSIDENVVTEAKEYAKETGKSLSKILEGYMRGLKNKKKIHKQEDRPPILKRLHGCIKSEDMRDPKDIFSKGIIEKYNTL